MYVKKHERQMKTRRLFLIAGYDPQNIADESLLLLVKSMAKCGDVILYMDSDCDTEQLIKFKHLCIYADAKRHEEYDFGSYKRAYLYAKSHDILSDYDFLYFINDSVYGPLYDIEPYLLKMESNNTDAFGLVRNPKKSHPHIQSWFIGMRKSVFQTLWFDDFILSVKKLSDKGSVTKLYEHGLSKLVLEHGLKWSCLYTVSGRGIYNDVKKLYKKKMPFIKKASFIRHNGSLGRQIYYVLNHTNKNIKSAIIKNAERNFGKKYMNWLLTKNPFIIIYRNISYGISKFLRGKI